MFIYNNNAYDKNSFPLLFEKYPSISMGCMEYEKVGTKITRLKT